LFSCHVPHVQLLHFVPEICNGCYMLCSLLLPVYAL
jgi:hypothetical protein